MNAMMKLRAAADWLFGAAVVCATLGAVALVCSHNHPHAPFVAVGLGGVSAALFLLRGKMQSSDRR